MPTIAQSAAVMCPGVIYITNQNAPSAGDVVATTLLAARMRRDEPVSLDVILDPLLLEVFALG
jgi:hypothetical protein